jgi:hypothetical protein
MTDLKYCKNCKHCRPNRLMHILSLGTINLYEFAKCMRPQPDDLVSQSPKFFYCSTERTSYFTIDTCGTEGKYWEARK